MIATGTLWDHDGLDTPVPYIVGRFVDRGQDAFIENDVYLRQDQNDMPNAPDLNAGATDPRGYWNGGVGRAAGSGREWGGRRAGGCRLGESAAALWLACLCSLTPHSPCTTHTQPGPTQAHPPGRPPSPTTGSTSPTAPPLSCPPPPSRPKPHPTADPPTPGRPRQQPDLHSRPHRRRRPARPADRPRRRLGQRPVQPAARDLLGLGAADVHGVRPLLMLLELQLGLCEWFGGWVLFGGWGQGGRKAGRAAGPGVTAYGPCSCYWTSTGAA
jgi:hypothetical protein